MKTSPQLDHYLNRVGVRPLDRLRWALSIVNRFRLVQGTDWSPGDWDNTRLELAVFAGVCESLPGWGGVPLVAGKISERPSSDEAKTALEQMQHLVERVEAREPIRSGQRVSGVYTWNARIGRYREDTHDESARWPDRIQYALFSLVMEEGHRVLACPSKLPHRGTPCRAYFVKAKRARYCSTA